MAKPADTDTLAPLWRAIENTPFAGTDRERVRKGLEDLRHEANLTAGKFRQLHEQRCRDYDRALRLLLETPGVNLMPEQIEAIKLARDGETNLINFCELIAKARPIHALNKRKGDPPLMTIHTTLQFKVLDLLLDGRPPDMPLTMIFRAAWHHVSGKELSEKQIDDEILPRYRKRFLKGAGHGEGGASAPAAQVIRAATPALVLDQGGANVIHPGFLEEKA
jgi:hypothetical protein